MALNNKSTIMAIVAEVTEGTPVVPSVAADNFIALQDGFSLEPAFGSLENAELTGTIGKAKSIQGMEEPKCSVSHYLRHSGVEGQEPNFGLLLKSILGASSVAVTEYDTISGSTAGSATTRGIVKVNTGEGASFERGEGLLIKDATNGYSIRCVQSVSTDDLNLNFNLANAPAVSTNLGKAVLYKPAESGHPTLSAWLYRANGGAIEAMAGGRVSSAGIDVKAGELINTSFEIGGISYYFDPIEITSATKYLDFTDSAGTFAAILPTKLYKDPHQLADAIALAMNDISTGAFVISCIYSDTTGKFTISTTQSTGDFSLLWNTGTNTANSIGTKVGFALTADSTSAYTYTSATAMVMTPPVTPSYETSNPIVAKNIGFMMGDFDDYVCYPASEVSIKIDGERTDLLSLCAESGKSGSLITGRTVSADVTARLEQYDVDKFKRFRENSNTQLQLTFGEKTGTNYTAGKSGCIYIPTAIISSFSLQDNNGVIELKMSLNAYVENGLGEVYINFL
jgi:hypothetical protein